MKTANVWWYPHVHLPPSQALTDALTTAGHVVDLYMQPEHNFAPVPGGFCEVVQGCGSIVLVEKFQIV